MTREEKAARLEEALDAGEWSLDKLSEETLDKIAADAQVSFE